MSYVERQAANDKSRNRADNYAEPWTSDDVDLLLAFWTVDPENEVAEALGRTIEACRQRFYEARAGKRREASVTVTRASTTVTTTTVEYRGVMDDPEDRFWSPDYYTNGEGSHA